MKAKLLKIIELIDASSVGACSGSGVSGGTSGSCSGGQLGEIERDLVLQLLREVYSTLKFGDGGRGRSQIVDPKVIKSLYGADPEPQATASSRRNFAGVSGLSAPTPVPTYAAAAVSAPAFEPAPMPLPTPISDSRPIVEPAPAYDSAPVFETVPAVEAIPAPVSVPVSASISERVSERISTSESANDAIQHPIREAAAPVFEPIPAIPVERTERTEPGPILRPDPFMQVTLRAVPRLEPQADAPQPEISRPEIARQESSRQESSRPAENAAPKRLVDTLLGGPMVSLKRSIGLNDRVLMVRDMFDNDGAAFDGAIARLDQFRSLNDAVIWLRDTFDWNADNRAAALLVSFLERKLGS